MDHDITNVCKASTPQQCGWPMKTQRKKVISGVCEHGSWMVSSYTVLILGKADTTAAATVETNGKGEEQYGHAVGTNMLYENVLALI